MPEYDPNRRITAVPRLGLVSKSEAAEGTDVRRNNEFERLREAGAEATKRAVNSKGRSFADALALKDDKKK
jgi:hypothetical protein